MANKFREAQVKAEVLEELYNVVESKKKDVFYTYGVTEPNGRQAKDWRTGELLWEDDEHTIPKMEDVWGEIEKEELSEEDLIRVEIYEGVLHMLEKML